MVKSLNNISNDNDSNVFIVKDHNDNKDIKENN